MPPHLDLPAWVNEPEFRPWLLERLEHYRTAATAKHLRDELNAQKKVAVPWLQAALRELRRGETSRLQHGPGAPMPGDAHVACWLEAHKRGVDFDKAAEDPSPDLKMLEVIAREAIAALNRQHKRRGAGRPPMTDRDRFLREVIEKIRSYKMEEWRDGANGPAWYAPTLEACAVLADSILIACGVPTASRDSSVLHVSSVKRAARRGR